MLAPGKHCCRIAGRPVIGIDEVGRGSIGFECTAAAVWFPDLVIPEGVNDSKKVSEAKRPKIAELIRSVAHVSLGHASIEEIDHYGIRRATLFAMTRAWKALDAPEDALVIIDGVDIPKALEGRAVSLERADATCPSVAAASIIAKVARDQIVCDLAGDDDPYQWKKNKGYGTAAHLAAIEKHGVSPYHRRSFAPIRNMVSSS